MRRSSSRLRRRPERARLWAAIVAFAGLLGPACGPAPEPLAPPVPTAVAPAVQPAAQPTATAAVPAAAPDETLVRLREQARGLEPLVENAWPREFLQATELLPSIAERAIYHDEERSTYYTEAERSALEESARAGLVEEKGGSDLYYETHYGTPLAYTRAIDLAAGAGLDTVRGRRVLDFGYGTIGHLRLLAALGAEVVGVDVDPFLRALYSQPGDVGRFPADRAKSGSVELVLGRFPGDADVAAKVGRGFSLVITKNVLKSGYIHPSRPVPPRQQFDLGVSDDAFVEALHGVLAPGGLVVIYNVGPPQAPADKKYRPHADLECPFPRAQLEKHGFEVVAFDAEDSPTMRLTAKIFRWDVEMEVDLEKAVFAKYTILRRRP